MLACFYPQGKQLASSVIGLLTCESHYNVSVINTTPCARLLLRHLLEQRIPTQSCEYAVTRTRPAAHHPNHVTSTLLSCTSFHYFRLHNHLHLSHTLPSLRVWSRRYMDEATARDDQLRDPTVFHRIPSPVSPLAIPASSLSAAFHVSEIRAPRTQVFPRPSCPAVRRDSQFRAPALSLK